MRRITPRIVFVLALATFLGSGARSGAQSPRSQDGGQEPHRFRWWQAERFQKELALTPDQVARIDALFQATLPELRQGKDELDRLETQLSRLVESDADEPTVAKAVDRTEAARSGLIRTRTLMLVRMRQVLTHEQRVRFNALHAERQERRPGHPRHRGDGGRSDK